MQNLTESEISQLNEWAGFLSFQESFILKALLDCDSNIIFVDTGNQAGKTSGIVMDYILRILGRHPIEKKNIRPNTAVRIIRFASVRLPTEKDENGEISNTVYPQFKKFFPSYLIKKDITARRPAVTIRDCQGGKDIVVEFTSYNQEVETQAGQQRFSVFLDEESPKGFFEEQIPRLMAADGDLIIGCTPVESITWMFEDIFQRASIVYNSPTIIDYIKKKEGKLLLPKESTGIKSNIALIRAASDDNPTLDKDVIEDKMTGYSDEALIAIRRYGIFHQISGVVHKDFDRVHILDKQKYFPDGIPHEWIHARGIDFHEFKNWACGWICLSNTDEAFIYDEYSPSPGRMVTSMIAREIASKSQDYQYRINLIDPRAAIKQANTGYTPLDDLNRAFSEYRREGLGTGGYWTTWDTKNLRGRDVLRERLKNSRLVGVPFNNSVNRDGVRSYLPTLWVLDNCKETIYSFKNWRQEEWANREANITKDEKDKAQDKYSHYPITFECIFKNPAFAAAMNRGRVLPQRRSGYENLMRARI
jgi:hypothetical protein